MAKVKNIEPLKFSQYFNLTSTDFDFVDIYVSRDLPLFLDPYGISTMKSEWAKKCEGQITTYFQFLVDSIKSKDRKTTSRLLNALHEVDEIGLGYSSNEPKGRGIGAVQALEIQKAFETSRAVQTGDIKDIADCALMIPGISRDKISDITANILKEQLILFTQIQCKKHKIPLKKVPVNNVFDYETFTFKSFYTELPIVNGKAKILLPINSVRLDPELSKDKYYRNFVLEFLKAEHQYAGDALATVLKSGKVIVRIGDLKVKYPLSSEFLYEFSKQHPQILEKYKSQLRATALKNTKPKLEIKPRVLTAKERIEKLKLIQPGNATAHIFHDFSFDNLIYILSESLSNPQKEQEINEGRKRIDIIFTNSDRRGFFHSLNTVHHVFCPRIFVECKNYKYDIGNPEIDQLTGRFSNRRGKFGILICRSIHDKATAIKRCQDALNGSGYYVLILEDKDIESMLELRESNKFDEIDQFLEGKLDELIL